MPKSEKTDELKSPLWVYVEFNFDARVTHYYGQIEADLFDRLVRHEVKDMVPIHHPYWYNEEDTMLSCREFQGGSVLFFDPAHVAFLMKLDPKSNAMKDILLAQQLGDIGLNRTERN